MKQPDQKLLAEQNQLQKVLNDFETERTALHDKIRQARQRLDEHTKKHGDMKAKQIGFERHQEFMNRPAPVRTPEWVQWFEGVNQKNAVWEESMCGIFWDKIENGNIVPFAQVFEIFHPELIGPLEFGQFRPNATVADLVVRLGLFPSLSEARKAGHNKPLTVGEHRFKNGKLGIKRVKIYEYNETR